MTGYMWGGCAYVCVFGMYMSYTCICCVCVHGGVCEMDACHM